MNSHDRGIPALTGLRFIAASMVLIGHAANALPGAAAKFLGQLAPLGMTLFFVLSGFVIWLNYAQPIAAGKQGALREFALARFARLYPMYLAVVLLGLGLTAVVGGIGLVQQILVETVYFVSLTEAWFTDYHNGQLIMLSVPYIMHLWSISTEVFFYALFPLIALLLFKAKAIKTIKMFGLANLLLGGITFYLVCNHFREIMLFVTPRLSDSDAWNWVCYYSPYLRLFQFLAGCITCHIYLVTKHQAPTPAETRCAGPLACAALVGLFMMIILVNFCDLTAFHFACAVLLQMIPLIALPYLMFFLSRYDSGLGRLLSWRPIYIGGEVSYSMYLLHPFVLLGTKQMTNRFLQSGIAGQLSFLAMTVLLVGLISWASYRFVEWPARNWLRRKLRELPRRERRPAFTENVPAENSGGA